MAQKKKPNTDQPENSKIESIRDHINDVTDKLMTTNTGLKINDDQNSLSAGSRGPTIMEDFIFREKMTHFDHERIPERVVHARGSGAHGVFRVYDSTMERYTKASFLCDPSLETPVFVRFSTVAGSRGSTDLARDVRGFATKFYTNEGNFDLVGNNIPVFFIQDAMKFPDLVHAVKPEQDNEIPQASSAHDTFWDFISLMPESTHMIMWLMSDRAIPRSYRMMEGFGVHTFRLVNAANESHFVKFHWKPVLGVHSVAWDEAQKISGKDPDFHRRDLWDAIERGQFPEYELGVQIVPEKDEHTFDFDLLDATKIIPEELVPVQKIGRLTLNRNPDNFFAETEQIAFHIGHIVPGIDFTNDPLLQGRLFSYTDTQLIRLGGPNFQEIPINRPIVPVHNNQREGHMRQTINRGKASYNPNSVGGGCPYQAAMAQGGFTSYTEKIDGNKIRERSRSFFDHFSQAKLFFNSQSEPEKNHIIDAFRFELGRVARNEIRLRMLGILRHVDMNLATAVAYGLGLEVPVIPLEEMNQSIPADGSVEHYTPEIKDPVPAVSAALSMENTVKDSAYSRKVAILATDGFYYSSLMEMMELLQAAGINPEIIATRLGIIKSTSGEEIMVDKSLLTSASVFYDAVYVPAGPNSVGALAAEGNAVHFLNEAYRHCKPIACDKDAVALLEHTYFSYLLPRREDSDKAYNEIPDPGVLVNADRAVLAEQFVRAIAMHRFWEREKPRQVPA